MPKIARRIPLIAALALCSFALLGASASAADKQPYIVVLKDTVTQPGEVARQHAGRLAGDVSSVYEHALKGYAAKLPPQAVPALERDRRVRFVSRDHQVEIAAQTTPTGIRRTFATSNGYIDIDGVDDIRVDADVAVLDTGIDFDHPDLNVVGRTNCTTGQCFDGSGDDGHGHGTHVAGTVGAIDNGQGVVGVAPGARLWGVKVLGDGNSGLESWIVAGVDWATARASEIEVVNMSLGCGCQAPALAVAITNSVDAGVAYAVAAGNSDSNAANFSPANHPDVITVSALADFDGLPGGLAGSTCRVDQDDTLADFSNWGAAVEVTAPGTCIYSTYKNGTYHTLSGTSMASPHVAGAAAILASAGNPNSRADVLAIRQQIVAEGNFDWTDDSGDGIKEPLLDVRGLPNGRPREVDLASSQTGRLDLVATTTTGTLRYRYRTSGGWSAWQELGGSLASAPVLVSPGPGKLDVFARGSDNRVVHRAYVEGSGWSAWETIGSLTVAGNVDAVSWGSGRLDVFARGSDDVIYHASKQDAGAWSGWVNRGGVLTSDPTVATRGPNDLQVFARKGDGTAWVRSLSNGSWADWLSLGGSGGWPLEAITTTWASDPGNPGYTYVDAFTRGLDGAVYDRFGPAGNGGWFGWYNHGAPTGTTIQSNVAAHSTDFRRINLYVRTADGAIHARRDIFVGTPSWQSLGGSFQGNPRVSSTGALTDSRRSDEIAAIGSDLKLYVGTYAPSGWQGWQEVPW